MSGQRIRAVRLLCTDPGRTAAFWRAAFGCTGTGTELSLGRQRVDLAQAEMPAARPALSNSTAFQHCAIVVRDMGRAMERLTGVEGWTAISRNGPETLAAGRVTAFKFRDPDGHPLEFLRFGDGSVPSVWRDGTDLFAGIDHSAITVADTARAVTFHARLGFEVAHRQVNEGPEQARLDGVDGPRVEVTGLRLPGAAPPHLELLCYRAPASFAEAVPDREARATVLDLTCGTDEAPAQAGTDGPRMVRDPDGHRLLLSGGRDGTG